MMSFVLGIASSLVASALVVLFGWFGPGRVRELAIRALSRVTGAGFIRAYPTQEAANRDVPAELSRAGWLKILTSRGNELTKDSFAEFWSHGAPRLDSAQVIVSDPDGVWLERREREIMRHDRGFDGGLLAGQIRNNLRYLRNQTAGAAPVSLSTSDFPQLCRIIATDRVAFMTIYTDREHGRNSPCYVYGRGTAMYDFAIRVFEAAWAQSSPYPDSENTAVA